ncbi:hypothetical protein MHYP_G00336140, partial [Metynnis hypsauchen]
YSIDRSTDQEQIFNIDAVTGAITLGKILDRETAGWHNITVTAVEADNQSMASQTAVSIRILDVNDNPPELATPYETKICEDAKPGQLIHTISVVDRDEPQSGHRFYFTLAPEASNNRHFALWDVKDNTAGIRTQRSGFNRQEQNVYLLPIRVVDSGPPALSSTGTFTIRVCGCDTVGNIQSCNATAFVMSAALSPGALIALLVCMLILIVLVLLILTLKRHRKGQRMSEDEEDMRDNVIKYNDEGGGEQDTQAYDMSALRSLYDFPEVKNSESGADLRSLPQWIQNRVTGDGGAADFSLFKGYIRKKVEQADADLSVPPYDSFQTYAFEGSSSPALSLSSIRTLSTTSEQDFSYLSDWGPRFRQLAGYYAPGQPEEEGLWCYVTLVDGARHDVPDVLNRIQVWGTGGPVHSFNAFILQELLTHSSHMRAPVVNLPILVFSDKCQASCTVLGCGGSGPAAGLLPSYGLLHISWCTGLSPGRPRGLVPVCRAWYAPTGRRPGGIRIRCPNHLSWLLSMRRSSGSTPSSSQMAELLTLSNRVWE